MGSEKTQKNICWMSIRAKFEEIMELLLFFGGGTLTILITFGILPWGALWIGICGTLAFIGASRFVLTNSFLKTHGECDGGEGFIIYHNTAKYMKFLKYVLIPIVFLIAGCTIGAFGLTGILGFSLNLGIGFGVPIFALGFIGTVNLVVFHRRKINSRENESIWNIEHSDNLFGLFMMSSGLIAGITFGALGLANILPWTTAIVLGMPLISFALVIGVIFVVTAIGYNIEEEKAKALSVEYKLDNPDWEKKGCWFLGLGFGPRKNIKLEKNESKEVKIK